MSKLFSPFQVGPYKNADLVGFGRVFSSNPDLPERLQHKLPLTPYVREAFWGGNEANYTDFPTYEEQKAA